MFISWRSCSWNRISKNWTLQFLQCYTVNSWTHVTWFTTVWLPWNQFHIQKTISNTWICFNMSVPRIICATCWSRPTEWAIDRWMDRQMTEKCICVSLHMLAIQKWHWLVLGQYKQEWVGLWSWKQHMSIRMLCSIQTICF